MADWRTQPRLGLGEEEKKKGRENENEKGKDEEKKRLECYVVVFVIIVVDGGAVGCCYCTHTHDALVTQSGRSFSIPTSPAGRSILNFFNKIRKKTIISHLESSQGCLFDLKTHHHDVIR